MSKSSKSTNVVWHESTITRAEREAMHKHKGAIIWFTGLSGSGKSTLSHAVEDILHKKGCSTIVLDGDNIRHGLNGDLGFSDDDRVENIRRIGEVAKLFVEAGVIVLTAFISPFRTDRDRVRGLVTPGDFIEVFCDASLDICEQRDPKGMYKKARAGVIKEFTGISSPYEAPEQAELSIDTGTVDLSVCANQVVGYLQLHQIVRP
ncbi:MAG: adenylylsulfate kinase [Gammaproteobacteria bacterium]|nr:MAG: adenylylsulfate kinase [Gammaproteobacteria bacterium]TND06983.1 MAG: adenylylsulfate kinase [Gammaproteobacteria bacterium]